MSIFFRFIIAFFLLKPVYVYALPENDRGRVIQEFITELEPKFVDMQGGAIAILSRGEVVYKKTFGYKKDKSGAVTAQTLFSLASVSKAVTGAAMGLMIERKEIDPEFKYKLPYLNAKVCMTDILSHTTGYNFPGNKEIERGLSRGDLLSILKKKKAICKPGACYFYSNALFGLTDEVLKAQHSSFAKAISELRTALNTDGIQILPIKPDMEIAFPHTKNKEGFKSLPLPPYYPKSAAPAAGVFASLDGMIEVYRLLFGYRPDLISQDTLNKSYKKKLTNSDMQRFGVLPYPIEDIDSYYGLGMRTLSLKNSPDKDLVFHSGYINGVSTFIGFIPSKEVGMVILINNRTGIPLRSGFDLWKRLVN